MSIFKDMPRFTTGNVVKLDTGSIVIVTSSDKESTKWIDFSHSNCSGLTKEKTHQLKRQCFCFEDNNGDIDSECTNCKGTGEFEIEVSGMDKAERLGENVKEYIIKSLTKNFGF